jgi:hypothetical protein
MSDAPPPQFGRGPRNFAVPPQEPPPPRADSRRRRWLIAGGIAALIVAAAGGTLLVLALQNRAPAPAAVGTPTARVTPSGFVATASPTPPATGTPSARASTSASPSASGDPRLATAAALFPPGPEGTSCGANTADYATACPVTTQFGEKLHTVAEARPPYEALCRCNVAWTSVTYTLTQPGDTSAQVTIVFSFSQGRSMTLVLTVTNQSGSWLGDDSSCGPGTSFDATYPQPQPCFLGG